MSDILIKKILAFTDNMCEARKFTLSGGHILLCLYGEKGVRGNV